MTNQTHFVQCCNHSSSLWLQRICDCKNSHQTPGNGHHDTSTAVCLQMESKLWMFLISPSGSTRGWKHSTGWWILKPAQCCQMNARQFFRDHRSCLVASRSRSTSLTDNFVWKTVRSIVVGWNNWMGSLKRGNRKEENLSPPSPSYTHPHILGLTLLHQPSWACCPPQPWLLDPASLVQL